MISFILLSDFLVAAGSLNTDPPTLPARLQLSELHLLELGRS